MTILITGASGYIGHKLSERLGRGGDAVCLSRSKMSLPDTAAVCLQGSFDSFEDLRKLDALPPIRAVVHLAAVTGGCSEEDGLAVNVSGTRRLYRYLLDRGCRKFVTASSIAATGCLSPGFIPLQLPIPDDHPCLAEDMYGLSKSMVEQLTDYFHRKHPDSDFINLRFGAVVDDDSWNPRSAAPGTPPRIPFTTLAHVFASDVLDGIAAALTAPHRSGVRTYNLVGPDASSDEPVTEVLTRKFGGAIKPLLGVIRAAERPYAAIYSMDKIASELGFRPQKSVRPSLQIHVKENER